jgi:sterol 3beta-glucosyltransferase
MGKKVALVAVGSRGDVQPMVVLGLGLKSAGYDPTIIAGSDFEQWVESFGLNYQSLGVNMQDVMNEDMGRNWANSGGSPSASLKVLQTLLDQYGKPIKEAIWEEGQRSDVIMSNFLTDSLAMTVAETFDIKHIMFMLQPLMPTKYGGSHTNSVMQGASLINSLATNLIIGVLWNRVFGGYANGVRQELGLPKISFFEYIKRFKQTPSILAFSPNVVPTADDWHENSHQTGYLFIEDEPDWQAPEDLLAFLDDGEAPIYLGFGSMSAVDPKMTLDMMLKAIADTGQRAIIHSGWAGLSTDNQADHIYFLDSAPHAWLFPKMKALVHHGGAGTTATSLRAGVPTFIIPHLGDQTYWGLRMPQLRVGPKPVPRPKLTSEKLADGIRQMVNDTTMQSTADKLGQAIRQENGVQKTVKAVKTILGD